MVRNNQKSNIKDIGQDEAQKLRQRLLDAMEKNAAFDAMGRDALLSAAKSEKISPNFALGLFNDGSSIAIAHYYWLGRVENLRHILQINQRQHDTAQKGITAKVAFGVWLFLTGTMKEENHCANKQSALQQSMAILLMPSSLPFFAPHLFNLSDIIWQFAGDKSTDYNYYTKRLLLAKIIMTSLMVYFQDSTPNKSQSEAFLMRQLRDVVRVGKMIGSGKAKVQSMGQAIAELLKTISPYSEKSRMGFASKTDANISLHMNSRRKRGFVQNPAGIAKIFARNFIKSRILPKISAAIIPLKVPTDEA